MPPELVQALRALGLLEAFVQEVHNQDPRLRPAKLEDFKLRAKKAHRKLALESHPDRGGSTERMAEVNAASDLIQELRIRPAPAPQPHPFMQGFRVVQVVMYPGFGGWNSVTNGGTTTSFSGTGGGWSW